MLISTKKIDNLPEYETVYEVQNGETIFLSPERKTSLDFAVYLNFLGIKATSCSVGNSWDRADYAVWVKPPKYTIITEDLFENKEILNKIKTISYQELINYNSWFCMDGLSLRDYALRVIGT